MNYQLSSELVETLGQGDGGQTTRKMFQKVGYKSYKARYDARTFNSNTLLEAEAAEPCEFTPSQVCIVSFSTASVT